MFLLNFYPVFSKRYYKKKLRFIYCRTLFYRLRDRQSIKNLNFLEWANQKKFCGLFKWHQVGGLSDWFNQSDCKIDFLEEPKSPKVSNVRRSFKICDNLFHGTLVEFKALPLCVENRTLHGR